MANILNPIKKSIFLLFLLLSIGNINAQTDFLFVVDNSGSISPSEFDAFADIIMETGAALDLNCGSSEYAIVHYGGAFGQEYQIQNDFMVWSSTSMVTRVYQDCVTSGTPNCGDDLHAAFGSIDSEIGSGLNPNTGNDLIVVIFTDADGMSQGQNNMSPCSFAACSTILPNTNFTSFMNSQAGSSSYVIGVEDTDNEGLLQQYLFGSGSYVPIDLDDDPVDVADEVSSTIECSSPVVGIAKNLTSLTDNMDGTYSVEYLLTVENFSSFDLNTLEIFDDIIGQFAGYMPTNFQAINGSLNANPSWSGTATSNVLATGQTIAQSATETVSVSFDITHDGFANTINNNATVNGLSPTSQMLTDTSTDGTDPDPNADDDPAEMVPTPITLPEVADIGIAKNLSGVTDNMDGTYTVEFLLTVENFSLIPLSDLEVIDDVVSQFSAYTLSNFVATNGTLTANPSWNGTGTSNILTAGQGIAAGATETVSISFDVLHDGLANTVNNTAFVMATTPDDNMVMDTSTDGFDPDPDSNGDPSEMLPTPVTFPEIASIGLAKNLTSLTDNSDGTYTIEFLLTVENFSLIPLSNLELVDNIVTQFAAYSPANFMAINGSLNGSGAWNGTAASNILATGQNIAAGATETVSISFDITHNGAAATLNNTATVSGTTPTNATVTDDSTDGLDPDPNGDDDPTEDTPTPVVLPEIAALGIAKNLTSLTNNNDGTFTVEFLVSVENLSMIAFTNVEVFDDIVTQFSIYSPFNFMAVDGTFITNSGWDGTASSNVLQAGEVLAAGVTKTASIKFDITHDGQANTVENTAIAKATTPTNQILCDNSTDGLNPDPDGNGDPEEEIPTPVIFPEEAELGLAKDLLSLTDNNDGSYTVQFILMAENLSLIPLSNLAIFDDIVTQFATYMPSNFTAINGTLNASPSWNGTATSNILVAGQSIAAGATESIIIEFDIIHNGLAATVLNSAMIEGMTPTNQTLTDTSTDGVDSDPNGDGSPNEQVPTPLTLPEIAAIGLAKNLTSLTDNADGTYTVEFLLTVENSSLIPLSNVMVFDDIVNQFSVYAPTNFAAVNGSLNASGTWNGTGASNILAAGQSIAAGQTETVSVKFDITHNGLANTVNNIATVEATTPTNQTVTDTSTDGLDPDPNGNGEHEEMEPTPLTLPEIATIGIAKNLTNLTSNNDGTFTVEYLLTVENMSLIPLTNLIVLDDIVTQFASFTPSNFMTSNGSLVANGSWNGTALSNVIASGQSLAAGDSKTVSIQFDIVHDGLSSTLENLATVQATTPTNQTITDISTDGLDPDPNGDENPGEQTPTPLTLPELGAIGLAKDLTSMTGNADNSYTLEYLLTVENFALFAMSDLEIFDDIITEFAGYSPMNFMAINGSLSGNPAWNGSVSSNILAAGQSIASGAVETVTIRFDVIPSGIMTTIFNTATVSGLSPSNTVYTDDSYNGLDPDPNMDDDPSESMPTPVVLPMFGMVSGSVWKDDNADGLNNNNEPGLFWVMVELVDCNGGVIASGFTDQDGNYAFSNIPPGQYMLNFDTNLLPDGCEFTFPNMGTDDTIDSDVDSNGSSGCFSVATNDDIDFDAGLYSLGTIGDRVWEDINGNGVQDPGEPGLNGVFVELIDASGMVVSSTVTSGNGNYFFELVFPGLYYIKYIAPSGYFSTSAFEGSDQTLDSNIDGSFGPNTTPLFELLPGETELDVDAGYYQNALIGETVFFDINKNNLFDSNENGINGMPVELWQIVDGQEVKVAEQLTHHKPGTPSDDGYFKFEVPPGEYFLVMEIPSLGLVPVVQNANGNLPVTNPNESTIDSDVNNANTTESFQINSGEVICNIGAGYYPMATIGNRTWADNNQDGIQNANEPSLSGVEVRAYDTNGVMIDTDISDTNGSYKIEYLGQNDYYLEFVPPGGYNATSPNAGSESEDSDIDNSNGLLTTATYSVDSGDELEDVDGGFILGVVPVVWLDFRGEALRAHNLINWETASELNASHFYIERSSSNTTDFEDIGRVEASGNSATIKDYKFEDAQVNDNEQYFYRLRQVDYNGNYSHSDIISIRRDGASDPVTIYPNPVVEELTLAFNLNTKTDVKLGLYDVQGKLILNLMNTTLEQGNNFKLVNVKSLLSGTYLVQGSIGSEVYSKKIIVY